MIESLWQCSIKDVYQIKYINVHSIWCDSSHMRDEGAFRSHSSVICKIRILKTPFYLNKIPLKYSLYSFLHQVKNKRGDICSHIYKPVMNNRLYMHLHQTSQAWGVFIRRRDKCWLLLCYQVYQVYVEIIDVTPWFGGTATADFLYV